jgi:ergothioneine biosynthesis protein EgtB
VKHLFSLNPLLPALREASECGSNAGDRSASRWLEFDEGVYAVGYDGDGFAYDNERPPHRVFVDRFQLANRPVTSGEFLEFVEDRGYERPELWLSEGWSRVNAEPWTRPIYWRQREAAWFEFTLAGLRSLDLTAPVSHLSYFEADAFARWAGARLPTEFEWEVASAQSPLTGHFVDTLLADNCALHPRAERTTMDVGLRQMFGDVWEWTSSSYAPYPGYTPPSGALGEYNGKFMCNQYVLRGGSCATPSTHIRRTYRNFFATDARWQFAGLRLAK